jgi:hypothetical protein
VFLHGAARNAARPPAIPQADDDETIRTVMNDRTKHIRGFLTKSDAVAALLEEIRRRNDLLARIRRRLPPVIEGHCRQATLQAERLTLFVDSPLWVDRLRFVSPQLVKDLGDDGIQVAECRVRVAPEGMPRIQPASSVPAGASPGAVMQLERAADCIANPALAESLRRLARSLASRP